MYSTIFKVLKPTSFTIRPMTFTCIRFPTKPSLHIQRKPVMTTGSLEILNYKQAQKSYLAKLLLRIDGVESLFFGSDFITVNKREDFDWVLIKPDVYSAIMDFYLSGQPIVSNEDIPNNDSDSLTIKEGDSETVQLIKEILETRIRPAIQNDGGDVQFVGYEKGVVKLKLQGACRTCSSSSVTLKHGIENMLKYYINEIKEVEQVEDELENLSKNAFEKLERNVSKNNK